MPTLGQGRQALTDAGSLGEPPCLGRLHWSAEIESLIRHKGALLDGIVAALSGIGVCPERVVRARLCLDEAITNAIVHGNRHDPGRIVRVELWVSDDSWAANVRDEGEGFQPDDVPDPHEPEGLESEGGRGLLLMRELMDECRFYCGGRVVHLLQKRQPSR